MKKKVTMKIPHELYLALKGMIDNTGFGSVNEFIVFVMRTIAKDGNIDKDSALSKEDIERVRQRLNHLGYL